MAGDNDVSMRRSFDELYLTASEIETLENVPRVAMRSSLLGIQLWYGM